MRLSRLYKPIPSILVALWCAVCISCADDPIVVQGNKITSKFTIVGDPVQASLRIAVSGLTVDVATRAEEPTENYDGEDTEEERHVDDLWIFEYDQSSGDLIYYPQYATITNQSELADVQVTLSNNYGKQVVIYVVANSGSGVENDSKEWVSQSNGSYPGFMTLSDLQKNTIPTPHPQRMTWNETEGKYVLDTQDANNVSIPMGGSVEATVREGADILVPVERMFAKLLVKVDLSEFNTDDYTSAWLSTVTVGSIPEYCTVATLWDGEKGNSAKPANYKDCERWIRRSFNSIGETNKSTGLGNNDKSLYPYIIYIPENIQGENQEDGSTDKADNVPTSYALSVTAGIYVETIGGSTQGEYNTYTAYPGGNSTTNFNVRRNCVYRVTLKVVDLLDEMLPSANCIVCFSGVTTAFWPYCRTEEGGGYDFKDYLDADDPTGEKKISYVKIIWQSKDGGNTVNYSSSSNSKGYIGDNSNNQYVWIDDVEKGEAIDEYHRRIHVSIPEGKTGNALIGAYNSNDEIIWSWHIWSRARANDPTTVNIKLYYTYDWDSNGIYANSPRVAGYTIMNCNLGAMQDEPNYPTNANLSFANALPTFGTLYQWGRKDPFPPVRTEVTQSNTSNGLAYYDQDRTGNYYDNANNSVSITGANTASSLFHSVGGSNRKEFREMIPLTIQNPTVFYAGTNDVNYRNVDRIGGASWSSSSFNYYPEPKDGNWMLDSESDHFNSLWGGLDPEHDMNQITKIYDTGLTCHMGNEILNIHLYDDYGEKSIFDPCPYGWRVSPPDLWLGFTNTGLNPTSTNNINYNSATSGTGGGYHPYSYNYGMTMYMTAWKEGESSFFPCQGTRAPDGCAIAVGQCGNYNNATADAGDRVNILHIHYNSNSLFNIFENNIVFYYIKSTASPVRCIRIDSVEQ